MKKLHILENDISTMLGNSSVKDSGLKNTVIRLINL
jgi:hypothetical protein